MSAISVALLVPCVLMVGTMIGCTGIGGLLLPPCLLYIAGLDVHTAMATSMLSFVFTGAAGAISYARQGSIDFRVVGWLIAGIVPASILGAWTNRILSASLLTLLLTAVILASGIHALVSSGPKRPTRQQALAPSVLLGLGGLVGFGSALTGTGGPVLLVPMMLLLKVPILKAVGVSQVIQVAVAVSATAGYSVYGGVDFPLGVAVGTVATLGVVAGAHIAHRVPAERLHRIAAMALILAAFVVAGSTFLTHESEGSADAVDRPVEAENSR